MVYGHKWVSSFGTSDDGTWLKGLCDIAPEKIGIGLEKCRTSGEAWPPTLPEFRAMCLLNKPLAVYHRPYVALPKSEITRERLTEYRRKILEAVGLDPGRAEIFPDSDEHEALRERESIVSEGLS